MLKLAEASTAQNLKVGVGLMSRHARALQELHQRIDDGELGDIILLESKSSSSPYQNEWDDLISAIREDKPYNEAKRGVEASVATSMGRMAAHTGLEITFEDMLNCEHEMAPGLDTLTKDSPAPVNADAKGRYPVPRPGITRNREY